MAEPEFKPSMELKRLVDDFYHNRVSFEDYRARRRKLLEEAQTDLNGGISNKSAEQPDKSGIGGRLMSLVEWKAGGKIVSE